jgi:hypothetical protein
MSDPSEKNTQPWEAYQKIWFESVSKTMQAAFASSPDSAPPELLRQIRNGILQALAEAWNEYLRSPQFQDSMKGWMDAAVDFRRMSNDFMAKARKEMQAPSSGDIDAVLLAVRHVETRLLDRMEELSREVQALASRPVRKASGNTRPTGAAKQPRRTSPEKKKGGQP